MVRLPSIKFKFDHDLLAKVLAVVIIAEGAALAASAHDVRLEGIGSVRETYVQLAGLQLLVLGLIALAAPVLPAGLYRGNKPISTFIGLVPLLVALAVIMEALVVAYYSASMNITGVGHVRSYVMAGFAAQLFFIGGAFLSSKLLGGKEGRGLAVITAAALAIGSAGAFVIGIAARTSIEGIGDVEESAVSAGGALLLLIAVLLLVFLYLGDRSFLLKKVFGSTSSTLGVIALSVIVAFAGLVLASYGAPATVQGIGAISEGTVLLFGLVIAFLGLIIPATMFARISSDRAAADLTMHSVVLLLLLFPFALFT